MKASSQLHFCGPRAQKSGQRHIFSDIFAELGPPWEPLLEPFWSFWGVPNFHAFFIDFWAGAGCRGMPCGGLRICKITLKFHHALSPCGGAAKYIISADPNGANRRVGCDLSYHPPVVPRWKPPLFVSVLEEESKGTCTESKGYRRGEERIG